MDITEFFQQSAGKWFSQRTSHNLMLNKSDSGKSDVHIEVLNQDNPAVIQLCGQCQVDPTLALFGVRITWDGAMEVGKGKQAGSTLLVPIPSPDKPGQGKLLREQGHPTHRCDIGRYVMGNDESLTLITEQDALYAEDRLWFASPNLRLRTSVLKQSDGFSMASFCSEIRMGVTKPASA